MVKKHYNSFIFISGLLGLFYLISILSCKHKAETVSEDNISADTTLPADFIEFYKNFHQDSAYQLSHIIFPLPGLLQDTAGRDSSMTWRAENWKLHKAVIPDDLWAVDFTIPMENVIIEFIHARRGGFSMERRFAKMDTMWNLIYYAGLRMNAGEIEKPEMLIEE